MVINFNIWWIKSKQKINTTLLKTIKNKLSIAHFQCGWFDWFPFFCLGN